jgi:GT2 family glycosyltransferase
MKVLVIIVTHNASKWIEKVLSSLSGYDILIVDNNSSDSTLNLITAYPIAKLIKSDSNLGFGKANNLGLKFALENDYQYAFLLNQDAWPKGNSIDKLVEIANKNTEFGILSPVHLTGDGSKLDSGFVHYIKNSVDDLLLNDLISNKKSCIYQVPFVNAAAWLISKECLQRVGGFDPIFFHYGEDYNYCQRVNFHGYKVGFVVESFIFHDRENRTTNDPKYEKMVEDFSVFKRQFLLDYCDVNADDGYLRKKLRAELISTFINLLICCVKLNYSNFTNTRKKLFFIFSNIKTTKKSRINNRTAFLHYIN